MTGATASYHLWKLSNIFEGFFPLALNWAAIICCDISLFAACKTYTAPSTGEPFARSLPRPKPFPVYCSKGRRSVTETRPAAARQHAALPHSIREAWAQREFHKRGILVFPQGHRNLRLVQGRKRPHCVLAVVCPEGFSLFSNAFI